MTACATAVTEPIDLAGLRLRIDAELAGFLDGRARAAAAQELPGEVTSLIRDFVLAGGKRLRPLLCALGWYAAGETAAPPPPSLPLPVVRAAASLEMFHAFAMIHDDIMDGSDTRRGAPSVHRALAARHAGRGDADRFGTHAAILLGDLAHAWSDELLHTAGLPPGRLAAARGVMDTMRWEVMYGQYLDLTATGRPTADLGRALRIVRYKTAKYTVERPLHLGAALAGSAPARTTALSAYALPLGEAFQLRDDILGVYGDPEVTGKSVLDDLRTGKQTVLLAVALARADPRRRDRLRSLVGRPDLDEDGARQVRAVMRESGALGEVERLIGERRRQALRALDRTPLSPAVADALRRTAHALTGRRA
ncbi:polyprenyl synthetase family protein [Streptomyces abikoensis]|uniref:polyprenyl synthetase family protein n=1 Tax=Streptomyces abikoensis TaxID=97398 RepID=UPI0033EA672C